MHSSNTILAKALFEQCVIADDIYSFQELLESRIDFIKGKYKGTMDDLVDHLAEHVDPTKNKKYTEWLVQRHLKGDQVQPHQIAEYRTALTHFDKASSDVHDTNIKNHTLSSMRDVAHLVETSPKRKKSVGEGLQKIYDAEGVQGFKIPDEETSRAMYGPGKRYETRWCTATNSANNMFNKYEGGKYTLHLPNGNFMQIHHGSGQTKDPNNYEIDFASDKRYEGYHDHIKKFMHQTADLENEEHSLALKHFGPETEEIESKFKAFRDNPYDSTAIANFVDIAKKHKISDEHANHLIATGWERTLVSNPHLNNSQVSKVIESYKNASNFPSHFISNPAIKGSNTDTVFHALLNSPTSDVRKTASQLVNLQPHHVDYLIDNMWEHPNNPDIVNDIIKCDSYRFTKEQINRIADVHPKMIDEIAKNQEVHEPHRTNLFNKIIHTSDIGPSESSQILRHNDPTSDELHQMIDSTPSTFAGQRKHRVLLNARTLDQSHIDKIVNLTKNASKVNSSLLAHEKFPVREAEHIITSKTPTGDERDISFDDINEVAGKHGADPQKIIEAVKLHGSSPEDIHHIQNLKTMKNLPKEILEDPIHANRVVDVLHHHQDMSSANLGHLIKGVHEFSKLAKQPPTTETINSLINHPNIGTTHIQSLYDTYKGVPSAVKTILEHPRTPPSIKETKE